MKNEWIAFDKASGKVTRKSETVKDVVKEQLQDLKSLDPKSLENLKKRKLILQQ